MVWILVAQWFRVHGICLGGPGFDSLQGYSLCDQVTLGVTSHAPCAWNTCVMHLVLGKTVCILVIMTSC